MDTSERYLSLLMLLAIHIGTISQANPVISTSGCKCWQDYQPEIGDAGLQCVALDQFHVMPCNMPRLPKCECTGNYSNILKDKTGTWCTKYTKGEELKRWACENKKDWDMFFQDNPEMLYTRYQMCRIANLPKCECSGNFSGIVKDKSGTWCIQYTTAHEEKKWACENKDEWAHYLADHPYFIYCQL